MKQKCFGGFVPFLAMREHEADRTRDLYGLA